MNGIQINGIGRAPIILSPFYPMADGFQRVWRSGTSEFVILFENNGWRIINSRGLVCYTLVTHNYDQGEYNVSADGETFVTYTSQGIQNPWSTDGQVCIWVERSSNFEGFVETVVQTLPVEDTSTHTDTQTIEHDDYGNKTEVTTYTDLQNGNTKIVTNVTKVTAREELVLKHQRVAPPQIDVEKIYQFRFVNDFAPLGRVEDTVLPNGDVQYSDHKRGIYRVDKIMTYSEVVDEGIDLFNNIYKPCRLPEELYRQDRELFYSSTFYKLVNPNDEAEIYYMPLIFVEGTPDPSVRKYNKYILTIDIGVYDDDASLMDARNIIIGALKGRCGIDPSLSGGVRLAIYDTQYMHLQDLLTVEQQREEVKKEFNETEAVEFYSLVCPKDLKDRESELAGCKKKLEIYEGILDGLFNVSHEGD